LLNRGGLVSLLLAHLLHDWDQLVELCLHLYDTLMHLNHCLDYRVQLRVLLRQLERNFFDLFLLLKRNCFLD
jgi:hypothetical protein